MGTADRLGEALEAGALAVPETGDVAVLRAEPSAFLDAVPADRLHCEQSFQPTVATLAARGIAAAPGLSGTTAALVVVNIGRNRAESLGAVARGLALLPSGGILAVNGAKSDGIDGLARQIDAAVPIADVFIKAHGRILVLSRPERVPGLVADWAEAAAPTRTESGFVTAPGMFSPEGPDPGSALLAEHIDPGLGGAVADLGAGWGYLAHAALARAPGIARLELVEADSRALDAARTNVTDPRVAFHWADATRWQSEPLDAILTNPPFHAGRAADPALGVAFIAAAARLLKPHGRLYLVANRQLPYEAPIDAAFATQRRLHEDGRYKVVLAERPRRRR